MLQFSRFWFQHFPSGPKSFLAFREKGPGLDERGNGIDSGWLKLKMLQNFNFDNQFIGKRCFKSFSRRTPTWKWRELLFVSFRVETADFLFICRCRWWQGTSRGEWFSAEGPVAFRTILSISAAFVSSVYPLKKGLSEFYVMCYIEVLSLIFLKTLEISASWKTSYLQRETTQF